MPIEPKTRHRRKKYGATQITGAKRRQSCQIFLRLPSVIKASRSMTAGKAIAFSLLRRLKRKATAHRTVRLCRKHSHAVKKNVPDSSSLRPAITATDSV